MEKRLVGHPIQSWTFALPFTLIQCFDACFHMQVNKIISSCLITLTPQRKVRTAGHGVNSFWQVPPLHLRAHTPPQVHSESKIKRSTLMTGCKCENHTFPEEVPEMYKCKKLQFALVFWNQVADYQKNAFSEPCHSSHNLVCTWRPGTVCVMQFLLFKLVLAQQRASLQKLRRRERTLSMPSTQHFTLNSRTITRPFPSLDVTKSPITRHWSLISCPKHKCDPRKEIMLFECVLPPAACPGGSVLSVFVHEHEEEMKKRVGTGRSRQFSICPWR